MLNVLKKDSKYTYVPGTPGTPGSPYIPAVPATCTTTTSYASGWYEADLIVPGRYIVYIYLNGVMYMIYAYSTAAAEATLAEHAGESTTTQTCTAGTPAVPAVAPVPPTPAQTLIDNNIGWNAGAISAVGLTGDGGFAWKVAKTSTGAVVGFASPNEGVGIADIKHGFYYASGTGLKVIEGGSTKSNAISYTEGQELKVMRINGLVTYWRNGSLVFTSATASTDTVYLDVSLYTAGDYVYDPDMFEVHHLSATASATTRMKMSGKLRGSGGARATGKASIRSGSTVDLRVLRAAAASAPTKIRALIQLSAKG